MSRRAWLSFAAVSLLWGMPYLFIKIAVLEVSPAFVAWTRVAIAGLILLPVAWRLGAFRGMRRHVGGLIAFAGLEIAAPFILIPLGETRISSSLTAILICGMPVAVALLAFRFAPSERLTPRRRDQPARRRVHRSSRGSWPAPACIILATLSYAGAAILVNRRLGAIHPLGLVAVALGVNSIALARSLSWRTRSHRRRFGHCSRCPAGAETPVSIPVEPPPALLNCRDQLWTTATIDSPSTLLVECPRPTVSSTWTTSPGRKTRISPSLAATSSAPDTTTMS
jgi:hypothetical protein